MKSLKRLVACLMLVIWGLLLFGCGAGKSTEVSVAESGTSPVDVAAEKLMDADQANVGASFGLEEVYAAQGDVTEQKVIKNAILDLLVNKAQKKAQQIEREAELTGGFVANSSHSKVQGDKLRISMTLRIPAEAFAKFMSFLESLGEVEHKRIYTEDVTQEYIDLSAKVESLTIQEKRLQELLSKATMVEDLLRIEQELARVRGEIDSYTGQLRYLINKVELSTIEISLVETGIDQEKLNFGKVEGTWNKSQAAFVASVNQLLGLLSSLIVAVFALLPFLVVPSLLVIGILLIKRKINIKNKGNLEGKEKENP